MVIILQVSPNSIVFIDCEIKRAWADDSRLFISPTYSCEDAEWIDCDSDSDAKKALKNLMREIRQMDYIS